MKVKERREVVGFGGVPQTQVRVFEAPELPPGAEKVDDKTPVCDWQPEVSEEK